MAKTNDIDLDWTQLRKDMDASSNLAMEESSYERLKRKFREAPLVPIGCLATVCALSFGLYNFKIGNRQMSQKMMRARVLAQGFTIVVAVGSTMIAAIKAKNNANVDDQINQQTQ